MHIKEAWFDKVASGHYSHVRRILTSNVNERTKLLLSANHLYDKLIALRYLIFITLFIIITMFWGTDNIMQM